MVLQSFRVRSLLLRFHTVTVTAVCIWKMIRRFLVVVNHPPTLMNGPLGPHNLEGVLMRILNRLLAGATAAVTATSLMVFGAGPANAGGPTCAPTWTIGIGGFNINLAGIPNTGQDSMYIPSNQPVGYNSLDINAGVRELDRLFWGYRTMCPGSHIKML